MPETPSRPTATPLAAAADPAALPELTALFVAIGDPVRHALLSHLAAGSPLAVNDLAARVGRAPHAVTKHLRVLRAAGFVRVVPPPDGDTRKQFHEVPARFRTRDAAGKTVLDFGAIALRFG